MLSEENIISPCFFDIVKHEEACNSTLLNAERREEGTIGAFFDSLI